MIMRKLMRISMTTAIVFSLLTSTYASSDYEMETKTRSSGTSLLKTALIGAALLTSPTAIEAQNPGFVGCYMGTVNRPSKSDNVSIYNLGTTNWNYYSTYSSLVPFYPNQVQSPPYTRYTQFYLNTECDRESYCKYLYIKSAKLCEKIFDINYYASIVYNPSNAGASSSFYLSVWDSLSSNNTEFEKVFSGYMTKVNCSSSTPTSTPTTTPVSTTTAPTTTPSPTQSKPIIITDSPPTPTTSAPTTTSRTIYNPPYGK